MQVEIVKDSGEFLGTDGRWYVADHDVDVLNASVGGKVIASATFFVGTGEAIEDMGVCLADLDGPYFHPGPSRADDTGQEVLHLRSLYTRPAYRRRGVMWQLVREVVTGRHLPVYIEFQNHDLSPVFERARAETLKEVD